MNLVAVLLIVGAAGFLAAVVASQENKIGDYYCGLLLAIGCSVAVLIQTAE